jgi:hypothetical protein
MCEIVACSLFIIPLLCLGVGLSINKYIEYRKRVKLYV